MINPDAWMLPPQEPEEPGPTKADAFRMGGSQFGELGALAASDSYEQAAPNIWSQLDRQRRAQELQIPRQGADINAMNPDTQRALSQQWMANRLAPPGRGTVPPVRPDPFAQATSIGIENPVREAANWYMPEPSPLNLGLSIAGGPIGGKALRAGAAGLGYLFEGDEAEAAGARRIPGLRKAGRVAEAPQNWTPPPAGHNIPPTGSLNPLDNVDVTFRGKQIKDLTPEEWQAFGQQHGVENLGPLSPLETFKDMAGNEFQIPGGLGGKWTYYDLLHMKANPINPAQVDRALHAEMQRKLGRTMTPAELTDAQVWNGLLFGMTSPNNPLFPNQQTAARLRLRTPEMLDDLAGSITWKAGEDVSKEVRKAANDAIAAKYQLHKGSQGGLGSRGTADYTRVAEMAQMFKANPQFFRKQDNESWGQAVERISSQLPGLSMKTGSFGTVWQDPANAAISAIDRHMARQLDAVPGGGIFASPDERTAWQNRGVELWNKREKKRAAGAEAKFADAQREGKLAKQPVPADLATDWDDLMMKSGSDGFLGEMLLSHVGKALKPKLMTKSGEVSKSIPKHLAEADWVVEPEKVFKMGRAYKQALDVNQKIANENGLNLFMSQWMEWDRIRNRFEPHENMFPGLERMPAPSVAQLREVDLAHRRTGHKTYGKDIEGALKPTRPLKGALPSSMGYLGIGGLATPVLGEFARQDSYQER